MYVLEAVFTYFDNTLIFYFLSVRNRSEDFSLKLDSSRKNVKTLRPQIS